MASRRGPTLDLFNLPSRHSPRCTALKYPLQLLRHNPTQRALQNGTTGSTSMMMQSTMVSLTTLVSLMCTTYNRIDHLFFVWTLQVEILNRHTFCPALLSPCVNFIKMSICIYIHIVSVIPSPHFSLLHLSLFITADLQNASVVSIANSNMYITSAVLPMHKEILPPHCAQMHLV